MTDLLILGAGLAGMSLAASFRGRSQLLEREKRAGGLCRSFRLNDIAYDVGPHIIFSRNKDILKRHVEMVPTNRIRRQNNIYSRGRWVKYPFENDLAALAPADRDMCLQTFLRNPYEHYEPQNMLQFFLRTFGEGMTDLYFAPYNRKIWKFDPSCLDLQMVDRIPKPPAEDIIQSAKGIPTEGYTHQLYFHYPQQGGIQSLFDAWQREAAPRSETICGVDVRRVWRESNLWHVETSGGTFSAARLVNAMPLHELIKVLELPAEITSTVRDRLLYNSIHIVVVQVRQNLLGDRLAVYLPDDDVLMHRLTRLNYFGDAYCLPDGASTLMAEITFRPDSPLAEVPPSEIERRVIDDLVRLQFVASPADVISAEVKTFKYAYVIYDLNHRTNTDMVLNYLKSQGIDCLGRFAEFEYVNTDQVVERTLKLAQQLNDTFVVESTS